tara:strand:- start:1002 stop:1361 length:360 start_codon:yes stop_codon:yes gene_type:complete
MKSLFIAGTIIALSTVSVQAEGISTGGIMSLIKPDTSIEYGFKTKKWSGDVGATATLGRISVRPSVDWSYTKGSSIGIDGASVKSVVPIMGGLSTYSKLSLDGDFKYSDLSIGLSYTFK